MSKHVLGIAVAAVALVPTLVIYLVGNTGPSARGGTIAGLLLGILATAWMVLLTLYGVRKHVPTWAWGTREGWMRVHSYLGIVAGLTVLFHADFRLGGLVTTIAALSYLLVVATGIYGIVSYAVVPQMMTAGDDQVSPRELIEKIEKLQQDVRELAEGKSPVFRQVAKAELRSPRRIGAIALMLYSRAREMKRGKTESIGRKLNMCPEPERDDFRKMFVLVMQKTRFEESLYPKLRYLLLLHGWIKVHLVSTAVAYAALLAHVASVVFYGVTVK
jgi:hypothetical protein